MIPSTGWITNALKSPPVLAPLPNPVELRFSEGEINHTTVNENAVEFTLLSVGNVLNEAQGGRARGSWGYRIDLKLLEIFYAVLIDSVTPPPLPPGLEISGCVHTAHYDVQPCVHNSVHTPETSNQRPVTQESKPQTAYAIEN